MTYPKIIVTGDSIAQLSFQAGGYGSMLCDLYNGKADVVNRGMGGYNSQQLLTKFKQGFVQKDESVRLFIIHIGTNDSAIEAIQTTTVDKFSSNLSETVEFIRAHYSAAKIILITPSTVDSDAANAWERTLDIPAALRSPRRPENTIKYVKACMTVGHRLDVPVIDCFAAHAKAMENGMELQELFSDGVHYTPAGYECISSSLMQAIGSVSPELRPNALPYGFESFWDYDVLPDSRAAKAAPEFEKIRAKAISILETELVSGAHMSEARDRQREDGQRAVTVS